MLFEVVASTAELEVVEVGWAVADPVDDVVGVAPVAGDGAAVFDAGAVADLECPSLRWGDEASAAADVEDFGLAAASMTRPMAASQARVCASAGEIAPCPSISQHPVVRSKLGRPARESTSLMMSRLIWGGFSPHARRISAAARRWPIVRGASGPSTGSGGSIVSSSSLERGGADGVKTPVEVRDAAEGVGDVEIVVIVGGGGVLVVEDRVGAVAPVFHRLAEPGGWQRACRVEDHILVFGIQLLAMPAPLVRSARHASR